MLFRSSSVGGAALGLSAIILIASIATIAAHQSGQPGESDVDRQLGSDFSRFRVKALDMLGLDESQLAGKSICLWSPTERDVAVCDSGTTFLQYRLKKGGDGRYRFAYYDVMVLVPAEHKLGVFRAGFDFMRGRYGNTEAGEYYYKDIVSIITTGGGGISLTFTDGRAFQIWVPTAERGERLYSGTDIPFVPCERAVQSIRHLVQAHKEAPKV